MPGPHKHEIIFESDEPDASLGAVAARGLRVATQGACAARQLPSASFR